MNPISMCDLSLKWQKLGNKILYEMAEISYWENVGTSEYPVLIEKWANMRKIDNVEEFEKRLRELKKDIDDLNKEDSSYDSSY